jgi:hypothetical protein
MLMVEPEYKGSLNIYIIYGDFEKKDTLLYNKTNNIYDWPKQKFKK